MRVAAIDCGTNSVRLLITDLASGAQHDLLREMRIVRLGQGVDRTGRLAPEALDRARVALAEYAAMIADHRPERVVMMATSAMRDAGNRADFEMLVEQTLGIRPVIITGDEEAALTARGAAGVARPGGTYLVVDIGGGSTEFAAGGPGIEPWSASVNVGAVRLTERHVAHDPPTPAELAAVVADVGGALDGIEANGARLTGYDSYVAVAGTATTLAAIDLGLTGYDRDRIHGHVLGAASIHAITARLQSLDRDGRAGIGVIHPGRVDVIAVGATVLDTVVRRAGAASVTISERDILDGIAYQAASTTRTADRRVVSPGPGSEGPSGAG